MMNMKRSAAIITLGCRLNQADSAILAGRLEKTGYRIVQPRGNAKPQLIIVNSCTVTAGAARKSRQYLRSLRRRYPEASIVITGCSPQVEREEWEAEDAPDLIVTNSDKSRIIEIIEAYLTGTTLPQRKNKSGDELLFQEGAQASFPFRTRAFLKVQDGCNAFCSYCIVPYARGRERSRDRNEVIDEFHRLLAAGHREITLTGVNICAYRHGNWRISELVLALLEIPGEYRIRLSSLEPHPETENLLRIIEQNPGRVCRFLHLPLQHGTDTILERMGRNYKSANFADFMQRAAMRVPGIHLGTDVIIGFPGESDELFRQSRELLAALPLANIHIFPFSPRAGTPAVDFADKVKNALIKKRCNELAELAENKACEFRKSQSDKKLSVILEKKVAPNTWEGWSDNYLRIRCYAQNASAGDLMSTTICGGLKSTQAQNRC